MYCMYMCVHTWGCVHVGCVYVGVCAHVGGGGHLCLLPGPPPPSLAGCVRSSLGGSWLWGSLQAPSASLSGSLEKTPGWALHFWRLQFWRLGGLESPERSSDLSSGASFLLIGFAGWPRVARGGEFCSRSEMIPPLSEQTSLSNFAFSESGMGSCWRHEPSRIPNITNVPPLERDLKINSYS